MILSVRHRSVEELLVHLNRHVSKYHPTQIAYVYRHKTNPNLSAYCYKCRSDALYEDMGFVFDQECRVRGLMRPRLRLVD